MANSLNINLTGKYVVLKSPDYIGTLPERVFLCEDGFGCSPVTSGSRIYGKFVSDGEDDCVRGCDVERLATDEEIPKKKEPAEVEDIKENDYPPELEEYDNKIMGVD